MHDVEAELDDDRVCTAGLNVSQRVLARNCLLALWYIQQQGAL